MTTIRDRILAAEAKPNVTAAELALLTGFSADTIRRAGRAGEIETLVCRGAVRYPRVAAMAAMKRRPKQTQAQQEQQQQHETADM